MRPTFIVIGAMKAGTTSLAAYLRAHPDVFVTTPKEPQFFGSRRWDEDGLDWYERLFDPAGDAKARGEASTTYTMAPEVPQVPERIAAVVPEVRLVYLVRNPVDRIRSHYVHRVDALGEGRSLPTVLAEEPSLFDYSRYGYQLDAYLEHFRREQILVLSSEALRRRRSAVLAEVLAFIGVDPDVVIADLGLEHNIGARKRRVWPVMERPRAMLRRAGVLDRVSRPVKQRLRRVVSSPLDVEVAPDVEARIWDELASDLRHLREIVGPDFDLWDRA